MLPLAGVLASLALLGSLPDVARAATAAVPNANLTADLDQFDLPTNLCFQNKSIAAQYGWTDLDDYANSFRTIVLEAGTWQTNMIACYAFQILVSEILGFDIRMDTYGGSATSGPRLANNVTDVTLELWPTDTSSWYHQYVMVNRTVIDYGPMGYTGRIGWYIPTYMVEDYPEYIYEFWRFLDNPAAMQNFTRAGEGPQGTNSDGTPECTGIPNGCQNGTYYPAYYDEADSDFWSVFYHMDPETSEFLVERLIDGLHLNMSVVYLGDTFAETLDAYFVERAPVIFYYWKPTSFVATQNLTRVSLPNDELGLYSKWALGGKKNALAVDYPTDILFKAVSVKFDEEFPDVASLLLNFQMSDSDILDLLRVADARNLTEDETACLWLTENQDKWEQWIPDPPQTLVSCPVGQGLYEIESLMTCISCFSGTYNWNPNNTGTCLPCPQNAKCPGGYHMLVDKGFWMADDFDPTEPVVITPEVYDCPYPETCCPEGGCDAKETCAEGFSGVLCTECSDPSAHLWNGKCMKCDGPGSSFYLILLLSPLVSFAFFLLPSSEMPTFELLFFYFQVINLIFASSLQGTVGFQYLQTLLSIASLDVDGIVTTCPLPIGGLSKQMFRYLLPSLLLFHIGSFYLIYRLLLKVAPTLAKRIADFPSMKWFLGGQDFGLRCLRVFNTMLTWTLMPLVEASLSILDCRSIIGSRLVYLTPTVNCADVDYKGPAAFAIIILVALMAAYPLFISFTLYRVWRGGEFSKDVRRRDKSDGARPENEGDQHSGEARAEHRELMAADIFYEGYKREFFWAEPLMLLERGVIVVCFAIAKSQGADDPTTSYTNICLFCALSVIRIYFQPYRHSFESFLNREICLGWLVATAIRILMLWTGLRASLSILIALTMFSPVALHLMRFARMKVLEARHAEIRDEVMASSVRSLPETTEKEKAIRDVHHEKESIGSALMTE